MLGRHRQSVKCWETPYNRAGSPCPGERDGTTLGVEVIPVSESATLTKAPSIQTSTEGVWAELARASFAVIGSYMA